MRAVSATLALSLMAALSTIAGCRSNDDPASYVTGLRVLAIQAEPPEIPPGASTTITALALDTNGDPIQIAWAQCFDPPLVGQPVNPDCVTEPSASFLTPVGDGLSISTTMPPIDPAILARPDASEGVYLPLVAQVSAAQDALSALYLLRIANGITPPNQNPMLTGISHVLDESGTTAALDESASVVVHAGDQVVLRADFAAGSVETYPILDPGSDTARMVTETMSVSWFSTAGTFASATSGATVADTTLHLDQARNAPTVHLPQSGQPIDLWVVARDERGGVDWAHASVRFE